jgi:large subunit ribosomal protein L17
MLSNMATSLILHKRITTTTAKAKALRMFVEPIITKSKEDSTHSRRIVFSYLKDKTAVAELFREVSPKIAERQGGYTRILKIGNRIGDNADMCIMELVDYNEAMLGGEAAKTKTTRRRRTTKKKDDVVAETKAPKAVKAKAEKAEKPAAKATESTDDSVSEEK